jgi:hypothetical protein
MNIGWERRINSLKYKNFFNDNDIILTINSIEDVSSFRQSQKASYKELTFGNYFYKFQIREDERIKPHYEIQQN